MNLDLPSNRLRRNHSSASFAFDIPALSADRVGDFNDQVPITEPRTPFFLGASELSASYIVLSGGTGCNAICSAFGRDVSYVLPVSDNGGSSSEIIRVIGGPSIGDIRSRLVRLIPPASPSSPTERIRRLLSHRLPADTGEEEAREGWRAIVEGRSELWHGIPVDRKETIRGFLVYFDGEVLKRANKRFSFRNASIGNFLLTAAHRFFRSVPSAIFLFSSITGSYADILPVLVTNHTVTIAAELFNGRTLIGQCEISHPSPTPTNDEAPKVSIFKFSSEDEDDGDVDEDPHEEWYVDALGGEERTTVHNVGYSKEGETHQSLESPIKRLFYINQYGQEIHPSPNPTFIRNLNLKTILVYSCGSLFTSIAPCLALRGVATAIAASRSLRAKVFLLNAHNDRETEGYSALDFINCITGLLNRHDTLSARSANGWPPSAFVTHLVYLESTSIPVDEDAIAAIGIQCLEIQSSGRNLYDAECVEHAMHAIIDTIEKRGQDPDQ